MLDESLPRPARGVAMIELCREDLELYGAQELKERIENMEAEIARTRRAIDTREAKRSAADALFSFKS